MAADIRCVLCLCKPVRPLKAVGACALDQLHIEYFND